MAQRTSHFGTQLAAARAGVGVALLPEPHLALHGVAAVAHARALAKRTESLPVDRLWLVGHRALRDVPRVAAVWDFLREEVRARVAASSAEAAVGKR